MININYLNTAKIINIVKRMAKCYCILPFYFQIAIGIIILKFVDPTAALPFPFLAPEPVRQPRK
jgi:hypothetical protein